MFGSIKQKLYRQYVVVIGQHIFNRFQLREGWDESIMSFLANGKQDVRVAVPVKELKMATALFEPEPLEKLNWLIHLQHVRGEISKCKDLIKRQIEKSGGKHEYAYFKQGIILREEGKIQEALESFQICHKLNCENTDNIKEVAKCLFLLKRYHLSLEAYLEAEKTSTKPDWEIFHNIGQCLMCLGELSNAREYIKRAVQLGKQESSFGLLIKVLISLGDLQAAVSACKAALESCPDSTSMLTQSGLLNLKLGQTQQAFENLSSALALDPSCTQALLGIGCITQAHEEYDVALTKYKIALQLNPESVALWNNIGMCFYYKQKYVAAVSCLKRALWLSPINWKVLLNLGLVHLSTAQPASAFNYLCAAVNLRPDVGLSFMALGCALFDLKDFDNSLRAFRQASSLTKNDPHIILNTSVALTANNRKKEASEFLKTFTGLMEQNPHVDKKLLDLRLRLEAILVPEEENSERQVVFADDNAEQGNLNLSTPDADQMQMGILENRNASANMLNPDEV